MSELSDFVIGRHGGADRWHQASAVLAAVRVGRGFLAFKGQAGRGRPRIRRRPEEVLYSQLMCSAAIERVVRLATGHGLRADLDHWRDPLETWHGEQGRQYA